MPGPYDPLSAERVAALVAPVIDRLRNSMVRAIKAQGGELAAEFGIGEPGRSDDRHAAQRPSPPLGPAGRARRRAPLRPSGAGQAGVAEAVAAGLLEEDAELRATARGRDCLDRLYSLGSGVVTDLWCGHEARVDSLLGLTERLLDAAEKTGGPAFAVMFPPYEPPGGTPCGWQSG